MDLKELVFFSQVCKDKSIRKAASNLFITHQGLSKSIMNLEEELGVELFNRTKKGIMITENGKVVQEHAEKILYNVECMKNELHKGCNKTVTLPIACSFGVKSALSPEFFFDYKRINSCVNFQIDEMPDLLVDKAIVDGKAPIGFTIGPVDTNQFEAVPIQKQKLYLLVHKSNPLSRKDKIPFIDLKNEQFILFNKDFRLHYLIIKKCEEAGFSPNIYLEVPEVIMCHKFAQLNYGIAVTTDFILSAFNNNDVCALPFEDEEFIWEVNMITKKGNQLSSTVQNFINYVNSWENRLQN